MKKILIYTDGCSKGNPGRAGCGVVFVDLDGNIIAEFKKDLGIKTNNQAEYYAVIEGLRRVSKWTTEEVELHSDSQLIVNHLNRVWRCKDSKLIPLNAKVREEESRYRSVKYVWEPREVDFLKQADKLANAALN